MAERLLEIKGLKTHFFTEEGVVRAVDGIDLHIDKGETLGVVGESGCGKTVTALSVMKLIPMPPGKIVEGQMLYGGRDLVTFDQDIIEHEGQFPVDRRPVSRIIRDDDDVAVQAVFLGIVFPNVGMIPI